MALALLLFHNITYAETHKSPDPIIPKMFFDADETYLDREGDRHIFSGNVVAIAANILLSADELSLDRSKNLFTASGHVIIFSSNQILIGESLVFDTLSQEFTLTKSILVANDPDSINELNKKILGISIEELNFETQRRLQLQKLTYKKEILRQEFKLQLHKNSEDADEVIEKYIILLQKEALIKKQENAPLSKLSLNMKEAYKRRRIQWNESRNKALDIGEKVNKVGYFSLEGEIIKKKTEDRFSAKQAFFSPCHCEENTRPAWGFRAEKIEAQSEAYAELSHPVLELKGIPILYLPFLKIPIKNKRQSGFLLPSLSHSNSNGTMVSQSVFLAFNEKSDSTITADLIESRGLRLGVEYRIQDKQHSGWTLRFESIRDNLWLKTKYDRENIARRYRLGLDQANSYISENSDFTSGLPSDHPYYMSENDPGWWRTKNQLDRCLERDQAGNCIKHEINNHLLLPNNTWRGQFDWHGQSIIAPRLNFVSKGSITSDHRYQQDLWIPSLADFLSSKPADLFSTSKAQIHLDGKNFYAGLGSYFADPNLSNTRYSGYQLPVNFKIQSRMFSLLDLDSKFPLYGQLALEQRRIEVFKNHDYETTLPKDVLVQDLGNGSWRRMSFNLNSPLLNDQIIQADFFAEAEYRVVEPDSINQVSHSLSDSARDKLESPFLSDSYLHTSRAGIHFSLPIDGLWEYKPINPESSAHEASVLEHRMNWDITFSLRPYAARRGNYGKSYQKMAFDHDLELWKEVDGAQKLSYFQSDQTLYPHQQVTFATSHDWLSYDQVWSIMPGKKNNSAFTSLNLSLREQAKQELFYSLDQPMTGYKDMFNRKGEWLSNRHQLKNSNHKSPLHFDANITYDYLKEKEREKEYAQGLISKNKMTEPWSPLTFNLNLNWTPWKINNSSTYNLYNKNFTNLRFTLIPPGFYSSQLSFEYLIENDVQATAEGGYSRNLTKTRTIFFQTDLIKNYKIDLVYGLQNPELEETKTRTAFGLNYLSPSNCWGIRFAWAKNYEDTTWDGNYYLGLVIHFLNYGREFGNFTSRFNPKT